MNLPQIVYYYTCQPLPVQSANYLSPNVGLCNNVWLLPGQRDHHKSMAGNMKIAISEYIIIVASPCRRSYSLVVYRTSVWMEMFFFVMTKMLPRIESNGRLQYGLKSVKKKQKEVNGLALPGVQLDAVEGYRVNAVWHSMVDTVCFEGELCYPRTDTNGCMWHFLLLFPCRVSEYFVMKLCSVTLQ